MAEGIVKCPQCGAPVESFQTRCSMCGCELTGQKVSSTITSFVGEIARLDETIFKNVSRNSPVNQKKIPIIVWIVLWLFGIAPFLILYRSLERVTGKKFWGKLVFVALFFVYGGIVCINSGDKLRGILFIVGAVLGVILIYILVALFSKPYMSPYENMKAQYILNFPIPNSREDILEFTSYCVTRIKKVPLFKILFTANGKKQQYWNSVWQDKSKQLYVKASIAMTDDPQSFQTVKSLMANAGMRV